MTDLVDRPGGGTSDEAEGLAVEPITQWDLFTARLRRHRLAMASVVFLGIVTALAAFLSLAHRRADIARTIEAARKSMKGL